jgi:hypothetical protein
MAARQAEGASERSCVADGANVHLSSATRPRGAARAKFRINKQRNTCDQTALTKRVLIVSRPACVMRELLTNDPEKRNRETTHHVVRTTTVRVNH